jgi:hypothetical protein
VGLDVDVPRCKKSIRTYDTYIHIYIYTYLYIILTLN